MTSSTVRRRRAVLALGVAVLGLATAARCGGGPSFLARVPVVGRGASAAPFVDRLLVYGRHGLTPDQVAALRAAAAGPFTAVYAGEVDVASGRSDYPQVPVLAFTADPGSYAAAAATPSLRPALMHGLVLSTTGAALRKVSTGGSVQLADGHSIRVTGVVGDKVLGGYEMATSAAVLGHPAAPNAAYLLVGIRSSARALRAAVPGIDLRVEAKTANGIMSSADTTLTQAQMSKEFGEFAVRVEGGHLRLDPDWRARWITSTSLPQLGVITCNKAVIPALRAAMVEITQRGLGRLVHTADFQREGGCWNPRVERFAAGAISAHAWGIAVDINVDDNPLGATPRQDPRLVAIMAAHGFVWGGQFLRPDGAHFQWNLP